jgi:hypothetical protein
MRFFRNCCTFAINIWKHESIGKTFVWIYMHLRTYESVNILTDSSF